MGGGSIFANICFGAFPKGRVPFLLCWIFTCREAPISYGGEVGVVANTA